MITNVKKTLEGINNVLARKLKNTKPITFIKDPNDNDSVTSNPMTIVNDHFASVEPELANKLQTVQRNYFNFMNGSNPSESSFTFNLQYSSQIVETGATCLEFSPNFLHSLFGTFVLTQMCPSPSPMLSRAYFGALK